MAREAVRPWRDRLSACFPERHVYIRSDGRMTALTLSPRLQITAAGAVAGLGLWLLISTAAVLAGLALGGRGDGEAAHVRAHYERLIADRDARLDSALAQLNDTGSSVQTLAQSAERRNAALVLLLTGAHADAGLADSGLAQALTPASAASFAGRQPAEALDAVKADQDRLIDQAETWAKSRAERLRLAYRLAGLDPAAFENPQGQALGGPLIEAKDPRALAAVLDVDPDFALRIQHAADDLAQASALTHAAHELPVAYPTTGTSQASGFGERVDPFTGRPAFHPGLDFAGPMMTPVHATAPGTVSFTGQRTGYGNTVEIDHGHGLKTRYGHLAAIYVSVGERVALGERIAALGSTGRSTGPHLHYEVWVDGRPQNPQRFLEAGQDVQQATE